MYEFVNIAKKKRRAICQNEEVTLGVALGGQYTEYTLKTWSRFVIKLEEYNRLC